MSVASLPAPRSGAAAAFDGTGAIYVGGGSDTAGVTTGTPTLYKYTVASDTWTALSSLPYNVRDAAAVLGPDGELEVIGGVSNGSAIASVETYDPSTDTWAADTSLPSALSSAAAIVDAAGRIDVIGGFDGSGNPLASALVSQVVNNPVAPPAFTTSPAASSLTVASGSSFNYNAAVSGNPLASFSVVSGPSGLTIDPNAGLMTWTPDATQLGMSVMTFQVANANASVNVTLPLFVGQPTADTNPPNPTYSFVSDGGAAYAIPGQQVTLQAADLNTAQPSGYFLESGPAGMTVDSNTGAITWTPGLADLGTAYPVIDVINMSGMTRLYPAIPVVFASPVNNVQATGSLATGEIDVSWTDPSLAAEDIAGYNVYLTWIDPPVSSRPR
jgi:hypothetical protein